MISAVFEPKKIPVNMTIDSKSLTVFFRNQGIYLFIALVVGAIFWAIGQPINPFTVILYSLCIGNFLSPPVQWLHVLYEKPSPYDWLIFLTVLCIVMFPVYALTSVIVWWFAPPSPVDHYHAIGSAYRGALPGGRDNCHLTYEKSNENMSTAGVLTFRLCSEYLSPVGFSFFNVVPVVTGAGGLPCDIKLRVFQPRSPTKARSN